MRWRRPSTQSANPVWATSNPSTVLVTAMTSPSSIPSMVGWRRSSGTTHRPAAERRSSVPRMASTMSGDPSRRGYASG